MALSNFLKCLLTGNCREDFAFNITMFFEAYVRQWLINTDNKTKSWVEAVSIHALMWLCSLRSRFFFLLRPLLKIR